MKRSMALWILLAVLLPACTRETQSDVKELGSDAKRELRQGARNVSDAVEDATD